MEFTVTDSAAAASRLDRFLAERLPELSRARLQTLIRGGDVLLNGRRVKPSQALVAGDFIAVHIPPPQALEPEAQDIPLSVLFEDQDLIVIDKPHGLVVHPGSGNPDGTLVNALLHYCGELARGGDPERPGIVHRLDKDTSGCIVAAKSELAHGTLVEAFANREVSKTYLAVVDGRPPVDTGRIENRIGRSPTDRQKMAIVPPPAGKPAVTEYHVRKSIDGAALVECDLLTGRTHQLRVHLKSLGTPILGDTIYAKPARQRVQVPRLMLHAWKLAFAHPISASPLAFESPPPNAFAPWL